MSARQPLDLKRHYTELSEKDADAVIGLVADLVVNYIKTRRRSEHPAHTEIPPVEPRPSQAGAQEVHA